MGTSWTLNRADREGEATLNGVWKYGFLIVALMLWAGFFLYLDRLVENKKMPLDWAGLWDGEERPQLTSLLLGMQALQWGATIEDVHGNPAFRLGGERGVLIGRWPFPGINGEASFATWVKLEEALPETGWVAFAGTGHKVQWGLGAIDGKPAAWLPQRDLDSISTVHLTAPNPWTIGEWTHIAVVATKTQFSLFVNGQKVAEISNYLIYAPLPDIWLGAVRPTYSPVTPPTPRVVGFPPPEMVMDDFAFYTRPLSPEEVSLMAAKGRGGLTTAAKRLEQGLWLKSWILPWVLVFGILLASIGFLPDYALKISRFVLRPEFVSVWIVVGVGTSLTLGAVLRIMKETTRSDKESLSLFSRNFALESESYMERIADLLRRGRDLVRNQPNLGPTDWVRWATENGMPWDYHSLDGIGFARKVDHESLFDTLKEIEKDANPTFIEEWNANDLDPPWHLPVAGFMWGGNNNPPGHTHALLGWNWLKTLKETHHPDGPRALLLSKRDVATTSLVRLRPPALDPSESEGIFLYLPVYKTASPSPSSREESLLGVVFAGLRVSDMVYAYWKDQPHLFGARLITGTPDSREAIAVDTATFFPETTRPHRPYLETESVIRTYGRRLFIQMWTTPIFHAHSRRYQTWMTAAGGGGGTLFATLLVALQTRARLKEKAVADTLRQTLEDLHKAQKERQMISRNIHDGAIQTLYAVQLHLDRFPIIVETQNPGTLMDEVSNARTTISGVVGDLRQFSKAEESGIATQPIDISDILRTIVERFQTGTQAQLELECEPGVTQELNEAQSIHLTNIAREALSNAVRHSQASQVTIKLARNNGDVQLEIIDNGKGFDPKNIPHKGMGLISMVERSHEACGSLTLESQSGSGTRLKVCIPVGETNS